jgi:predicted DNA-binding WGR domain protein
VVRVGEVPRQVRRIHPPRTGTSRFELVEGSSSKFWEIQLAGVEQTVRFGRIGTAGHVRTKTSPDERAARLETDSLIREKVRKGYREAGPRSEPA